MLSLLSVRMAARGVSQAGSSNSKAASMLLLSRTVSTSDARSNRGAAVDEKRRTRKVKRVRESIKGNLVARTNCYHILLNYILLRQILDPDTMEELPLVRTGLEGTYQAARVAKEAQERITGRSSRGSWGVVDANKDVGVGSPWPEAKVQEDYASLEEEDDYLPEGLTLADIPRFKKIHGWDKENKQLRFVLKLFST